jgi:seryl-tRNA synthetase
MIVCILENNQQADGSIVIPRALQPHMMGLTVINRKTVV